MSDRDRPTPIPNGNAEPGFDPHNPTLEALAGVLVSVIAWQDRHGSIIVRIADRLGVSTATDPPPGGPNIPDELASLRASDADISSHLAKVDAKAAEAKLAAEDAKLTQSRTWGTIAAAAGAVRDNTPKLVKTLGKVGAALTLVGAAAGGLLAFAQQIWAAFHGR